MSQTLKEKFAGVGVGPDFAVKSFHDTLQAIRSGAAHKDNTPIDITFKEALQSTWGDEMTPDRFYRELGIDLKSMTVEKLLNTSEMNRFLLPEIIRDAVRIGLMYTPFYSKLVAGEETINGSGVTMPKMDWTSVDQNLLRLRDVNEAATIPEADVITWSQKQVNIHKKARGLRQTYESIQFTPVALAAMYFEELGVRLGADLDTALVDVIINGEQADLSEAAPVIGATTANTLTYLDIVRAWVRFKRIFRNSTVMLMSEADALNVLNMEQFQKLQFPGAQSQSGVTLNFATPLPTSQDIYVHSSVPAGKIILIDVQRMAIQLTAFPLLTESDKIISRQLNETFISIMTGFAILFKDGRLVLDYTTTLVTNPGPTPFIG